MFVKIKNNKVVSILNSEKLPPLHRDLRKCYVECDESVNIGDSYENGIFTLKEDKTVSISQINNECRKRIDKILPNWMIAREVSGGKMISQDIKDEAEILRKKCNDLEKLLPNDYYLDKYWK